MIPNFRLFTALSDLGSWRRLGMGDGILFDGGAIYIWVGLAAGLFATSSILGIRWYHKTRSLATGGKILEDE